MPDHLGDDMRKVKDEEPEETEIKSLDEGDIELLKTYGQGQYHKSIKQIDEDIQKSIKQVNELTGIKESDTGLAPPALWDLAADKQTLQNEQPLQVARCTKIINADSDDPKYIINVKQFAKFVVDLADSVAPTDIEERMRVGVDRNKYQIHIPLPPKIDPTVTMMQVEEKPDVTYSDVGGCKEQIEKLREVVETPLKGDLLTLGDALTQGVILAEGRSIFDIDGFRDPFSGEFISLNLGLSKNIILRKGEQFLLDTGKGGGLITLNEGVENGLVRPEVFEMLNRQIGVFDSKGSELSVLDLVFYELIDPKSGYLLEYDTKTIVPLDTAIERKIITPEGALLLSSLLNITLTTETVTKTIKRYVTVTSTENVGSHKCWSVTTTTHESPKFSITFTEAVQRGFLDEKTQTFQDPVTNNIYTVQKALNYGILQPDSEPVTPKPTLIESKPAKTTIKIVKKSFIPEEVRQETKIEKRRETKTEIQHFNTMKTTEKQIVEVPPEGWLLSEAISHKIFDDTTGMLMIPGTDRLVSFEECIKMKIINPHSALVVDPSGGRKISIERSLDKRILSSTAQYKPKKGAVISMKDAIAQNKVLLKDPSEIDNVNQRLIQITKIDGEPDLVEVSDILTENSPKFVEIRAENRVVEMQSPDPVQLEPGAIYDPATALVIFSQTGRAVDIVTAVREGHINGDLVKIRNPRTGQEVTIVEAIEKGLVDSQTGEIIEPNGNRINLVEAAKTGLLIILGSPLVAAEGAINQLKLVFDPATGKHIPLELAIEKGLAPREDLEAQIFVTDTRTQNEISLQEAVAIGLVNQEEAADIKKRAENIQLMECDVEDQPSQGKLTRARITIEPKYKVAIGRAKSLTSPEREAKPVVLQKMRKKVIKPKDAIAKGIIDQDTGDLLENRGAFVSSEGDPLTLEDAMAQSKINPEQGQILDIQRGDILNIRGAIDRGILDAEGTNQIMLPVAKSLTVRQLVAQGLFDHETAKIVHPETGVHLTLREAIVCEIVDPFSGVIDPNSRLEITLEEAIRKGHIDDDLSKVYIGKSGINLIEAVKCDVFPADKPRDNKDQLPLVGMTFPVAVKRGLIDSARCEIIHPLTGYSKPIKEAIQDEFIMALPYTPSANGVDVENALASNLVDTKTGVFKDPVNGDCIPISEAVETGQLVIKPLSELVNLYSTGPITSVTETVTSYHTITTKTIELLAGYTLLSSNEVKNLQTGEIFTLEQAKELGIIKDESEVKEKFATREIKNSFTQALKRGLLDMTAGTYRDPNTGNIIPISQAVKDGILETDPSEIERQTSEKMTIIEACDNIYDEATGKFKDPNTPGRLVDFTEAVEEGIVDGKSIVYDVKTGKSQTVEEGIQSGLIDSKTGDLKQTSGAGMKVKEAAKIFDTKF